MSLRYVVAALAAWAGARPAQADTLCGAVDTFPGRTWRQADPSRYGWDEARLAGARELFESMQSAAVMVVHRGRLIASWGSVAERYTAQSVRKGLLSSLVGQLVEQDRLSLDATLAELGIDDVSPPLTQAERQATLRDLLHSRSGIFHSALYEAGSWVPRRRALAEEERAAARDLYPPGAYWIYNNWDFNAVGTIVERASGQQIGPLWARRIARPTHMQDFHAEDVEYTTSDHPAEQRFGNVSEHRAYVFNISTRDLARYGLLYLNCGRWRGREIIPADWVRASIDGPLTSEGRAPDRQETGFGRYGYFWIADHPGEQRFFSTLALREPFYFSHGNRGHLVAVFPALDLVVAHQVATVGGVGAEAQERRAREGSPDVRDRNLAALLAAIISAHPQAASAFAQP
jgi:CubicO group peptidase (beta-lactamase class C family)